MVTDAALQAMSEWKDLPEVVMAFEDSLSLLLKQTPASEHLPPLCAAINVLYFARQAGEA